jgi:luciferase family oxidoreductase group 1
VRTLNDLPLSVLDLASVYEGMSHAEAIAQTIETAKLADELGYRRFWVAEHHGMPAVASSAPAVLIGAIADATKRIRVGSGGVMLPNHSSLVIAEQFGTLVALHGDRIDLGLGRAPGTDQLTASILRRNMGIETVDDFPNPVIELLAFFRASGAGGFTGSVAVGLEWIQRPPCRDARAAVCVCSPLRWRR